VFQSVPGIVPQAYNNYPPATINGTIGQPLSYQFQGFSEQPSQFLAVNLPAGLSLDPFTGLLWGQVDNPPPLLVQSRGMVAWSEKSAFADSLTASGGVPPYAWQIAAGSLPTGLSLSQNGVISGTPSIGGTSNFTVRVVDAKGFSAEGQLKIRIIPKVSSGGGVFFRNLAGTLFGTYTGSGDGSSFTGSAHGSGGFSGSADGTGGFSFTGSAADSPTAFNSPSGITVDSAGNIFVGDSGNHAIRKIFTDGRVEIFAGSFSGSSDQSLGGSFTGSGTRDDWGLQAEFNNPQGLAADGSGNLFVAESGSHRIRKVSPFGQVTHYVGGVGFSGSADGSPTAARFNKPSDVAVDSSGNIFVADSGNHAIRRIAANGTVSTWAGTMGAAGNTNGNGTAARFRSPQGVAVDGSGNVYVADTGNSMIRRISANRTVTTLAGAAFTGSAGEQYGRASFTGSAYASFLGSAGPDFPQSVDGNATTSRFSFPTDIEVDTAGNLYVTDRGSSKIRKISTNGTVTTLGNSPDGFFFNPLDLAVSANGTIFVADTGDNRIAMTFTPTPEITIELPGGVSLAPDQSAIPFGPLLLQNISTQTYTVRNSGYADLTGIAISKNGTNAADFSIGTPGATTLAPGNSTTFTVTFTPSSGGNRTAQLAVASNDPVNNPFRVNLAGFGLSSTLDSDGDGVSDAAEFQMGSLGFDWKLAQADKASAFLAGVNAGGLYNTSQIQAMNIGTPMISKNTSTGRFELTVGVQKSTNLQTFQHFSLNNTETTIEPDGTLKIRFNATENAAFFRLQAK
jgi:sugar lactone lactonase YvrE